MSAPSLDELHQQLARAKNARLCAEMIDDFGRMQREVAACDMWIRAIRALIAEREAA